LRRKAGVTANDRKAAIANALYALRGERSTALLHSKKPVVANPSCAAYTWSAVSVEVLTLPMLPLQPELLS
jgi:hypothetical protein